MARMTKLQIDYMENKINQKVEKLIREKAQKTTDAGRMTLRDLENALSHTEMIKWAKALPKAKLIGLIDDSGSIRVSRPYKYHGKTIIDQINTAEAGPGYQDFLSFVKSKKVKPLLGQIRKDESLLAEYEEELTKEGTELMDTMVLSGSSDSVKQAIEQFMAK